MKELIIALGAAVLGFVGAIVSARAARAGALTSAEAVRRQVKDQATAEQAHWLRQQRLTTYEGFLEAWDECRRLTEAPSDLTTSEVPDLIPLRAAAGRLEERSRRIALLGPLEVTRAAQDMTTAIHQDVKLAEEFSEAAASLLSEINGSLSSMSSTQMAMTELQDDFELMTQVMADAGESDELVDAHPLLEEALEGSDGHVSYIRERIDRLLKGNDRHAALLEKMSEVTDALIQNHDVREQSREQFASAVRHALTAPPLPTQ